MDIALGLNKSEIFGYEVVSAYGPQREIFGLGVIKTSQKGAQKCLKDGISLYCNACSDTISPTVVGNLAKNGKKISQCVLVASDGGPDATIIVATFAHESD